MLGGDEDLPRSVLSSWGQKRMGKWLGRRKAAVKCSDSACMECQHSDWSQRSSQRQASLYRSHRYLTNPKHKLWISHHRTAGCISCQVPQDSVPILAWNCRHLYPLWWMHCLPFHLTNLHLLPSLLWTHYDAWNLQDLYLQIRCFQSLEQCLTFYSCLSALSWTCFPGVIAS